MPLRASPPSATGVPPMIGTRLGPYEITAKLGEGGMGEVWRATDTRLDRDVAIKVLPAGVHRGQRAPRPLRARGAAPRPLNHPQHRVDLTASRIGAAAAPSSWSSSTAPTLAERLEPGPLPSTRATPIARQIAEALEEAHEQGIVHRDLKPQNVKAPADGKVKVLDFGLAKAMDPAAIAASARPGALADGDASPTLTATHGTQLGVILGTAAYMAPEQARGEAVDKRADIWAFGVVLFEMLTGGACSRARPFRHARRRC